MQRRFAPGGFNHFQAFGLRTIVKAHFRFLPGKLKGSEDSAIQVRPDMVVKRFFSLPLFGISHMVVEEIFF